MGTSLKDNNQLDVQLPLIESNNLYPYKNISCCNEINGLIVSDNRGDKNILQIQSRRYLGNKHKLLRLIDEVVKDNCKGFESFCDIFAGTGVVGHAFNSINHKIISNELLYSNYMSLYAWLSPESYSQQRIIEVLRQLNEMKCDKDNYVSDHFGDKYFSIENARKIGETRDCIENLGLNKKEKSIILTSLLYAMDKVANTCGHYDAFRKKLDTFAPIRLLLPDIKQEMNANNEVNNEDANKLVRIIKADILYIDPPYNSRQYSDTYHLLENIISWEKPDVYGKAKKMNRKSIKSMYCTKEAPKAFYDLILNAKCKYILVSYNNMSDKGNDRSNARIKDEEILGMLKSRGSVEIYEKEYKPFTTGKSSMDNHTERVFCCKAKS